LVEETARRWWARALELVGVWSVAIAYPMIQGATSGPDAFTLAAYDGIDVFIFLLVLILLAPLVAAGIEALIRVWAPRIADWFHAGLVALCAAVVSWQVTQSATQSSLPRYAVPIVVFSLVLWAYLKFDPIREVFAWIAFAPLVIVAVTLFADPTRSTVFPTGDQPSAAQTQSDPPLVMLVLDELPLVALLDDEGEIDRRLFPGFADLAEVSTWYRSARANADFTVRALPAILTGSAPAKKQIPPTRRNYPDNLFTIVERAGYEMNGRETRTTLCPQSSCPSPDSRLAKLVLALNNGANYGEVLPDNLDARILSKATRPLPEVNRDQAAHLREFVESLDPQPGQLDFLHVELPHFPWQLFPDGVRHNGPYYVGMVAPGGPYTDATWTTPVVDQGMQRMMMQLAYVDRQIQGLLDKLKSSAEWDDAMLVVMADHGASFEQGVERRHISEKSAGWQLPVPLFVKYPGQASGEVVEYPVSTSDVVPTILQTLGLALPEGAVGLPLSERPDGELPAQINYYGKEFRLSEAEVEKKFEHVLRRRNQLFGSGSFYALAGGDNLIGRPIERLRLQPLEVDVEPSNHLQEIDLDGEEIASYWSGYVREGIKPTSGRVAIAVNGKVATTVPTWESPERSGTWRIEAILPPEFLRDGQNEVQAYALP
jgi:hypothetical protein